MTPRRYADFDFSGPSTSGLPPIPVSADDERFKPWTTFAHTEAKNAPGVYRVICALLSEPDAEGGRVLVESSIYVLDSDGEPLTRRINLHVKDP